ncbi:helix-turn-helix domain-containing protein [Lysinibacillus sp. NPDC047702]|uniref:helix-turn-helix domain-containing protein n=1 Tax=unclassified Lysinibacillus TaxID=2636778 RepID=UPI003CFC3B12
MNLLSALDYRKLLKKFRKNAEMTQEEIADKLNISQSHVSKYESGRKIIDIETFMLWTRITNSDAHLASVLFGVDLLNTATQIMPAIPMFIGGMSGWML